MEQDHSPWEEELDLLLSEDYSSVIERETKAFDKLTAPFRKSLVLFGAGNLGRQILAQLRQDGIEPLAFSDNNPAIWGKIVDGIQIFSPKDAANNFGQKATFVVTIWNPGSHHRFAETKRILQSLNCKSTISFMSVIWKYSEFFLPTCFLDLPHKIIAEREEVKEVSSLWDDEESRATYLSQLKWRILENFNELPACSSETQYFPKILKLSGNETFVDCGAYDGDTIRDFLAVTKNKFNSVQAFEPDPSNFQKLSDSVQTLSPEGRFVLHQKAVGARFETLRFDTTGTISSLISPSGKAEVNSIPLDSILENIGPSIIKMDIEGAELDALLGARKIITEFTPALAICTYHKPNHLWKIPLFIASLSNDYHFFLRAHQEDGWDVVCYAIPSGRLQD